jgi:hypothetical protein
MAEHQTNYEQRRPTNAVLRQLEPHTAANNHTEEGGAEAAASRSLQNGSLKKSAKKDREGKKCNRS